MKDAVIPLISCRTFWIPTSDFFKKNPPKFGGIHFNSTYISVAPQRCRIPDQFDQRGAVALPALLEGAAAAFLSSSFFAAAASSGVAAMYKVDLSIDITY